MNINRCKFMHYVLIILLMITPLRSVLASMPALSHCDMADMDMTVKTMSMQMQAVSVDTVINKQAETDNTCCCCDGATCASNCDMGMSASILIQSSNYTPVFINTKTLTLSASNLLVRALTPPSRPPVILS